MSPPSPDRVRGREGPSDGPVARHGEPMAYPLRRVTRPLSTLSLLIPLDTRARLPSVNFTTEGRRNEVESDKSDKSDKWDELFLEAADPYAELVDLMDGHIVSEESHALRAFRTYGTAEGDSLVRLGERPAVSHPITYKDRTRSGKPRRKQKFRHGLAALGRMYRALWASQGPEPDATCRCGPGTDPRQGRETCATCWERPCTCCTVLSRTYLPASL